MYKIECVDKIEVGCELVVEIFISVLIEHCQ
jgi:hypothetical protein